VTPNFPAKVVPVNLAKVGKVITKKGAYMASTGDVKIIADFDCCSCACCFGGMGMVRQTAEGTGVVFLAASGTIVQKHLSHGEKLLVDTDSVVGFQETVKLGVRTAGGCCTCCCGGEGMFNTTLEGPGMVIIQSMSFEKYQLAVAPPPPQ
jgi:uncharacterized protein (AIM24 family)